MNRQTIIDAEAVEIPDDNPLLLPAGELAEGGKALQDKLTAIPQGPPALAPGGWKEWQSVAGIISRSGIAPSSFRDNGDAVMVALDMAHRMNVSPLALMQKLFIIHGKPDLEVQFLLGLAYQQGRFSVNVQWECREYDPPVIEEGPQILDNIAVRAYATMRDGTTASSTLVKMTRAIAEGWTKRKGSQPSKYETMGEDMLRYRSAGLLLRQYCPDLTLGAPLLTTYAPQPTAAPSAADVDLLPE